MKKLTFLTAVATVFFMTSFAIVDSIQSADAIKSKGNALLETGSDKVCGDKLCSKMDSYNKMKSVESMDMQTILERMDAIHENHQQQMMQYWNTLNAEQQSQMYSHMQSMVEYMETMDMHEHMAIMLNMSKNSLDMPMYHDEKYKNAETIAMQHLKTFDELDFDVFTNQQWDRLKESHSENIIVHWPDGSQTKGIERHIEDLKAMFVYAPDTKIQEHPVKIASGEWTSVIGVMEGTFTEPMPLADGTTIPPTGKSFKLEMVTVGHWKDGVMDEEYLFWDNLSFMKQIGLA